MGKIICVASMKGGVSKTLTTFNIAGILAEKGYRVLCIDIDPQANLTSSMGIDISDIGLKGTREIFDTKSTYKKKCRFEDIVIMNPIPELHNLDLIPGTMLLHEAEFELAHVPGKESILKYFIQDNKRFFDYYHYILIDTNPSLGYLNQNALVACDSILTVITPDASSVNGVRLFEALWNRIRVNLREEYKIEGVIVARFDRRIKIDKLFMNYICESNSADDIKNKLFHITIPNNAKLKEASVNQKPINIYEKKSTGYVAYNELTNELFEKGVL